MSNPYAPWLGQWRHLFSAAHMASPCVDADLCGECTLALLLDVLVYNHTLYNYMREIWLLRSGGARSDNSDTEYGFILKIDIRDTPPAPALALSPLSLFSESQTSRGG